DRRRVSGRPALGRFREADRHVAAGAPRFGHRRQLPLAGGTPRVRLKAVIGASVRTRVAYAAAAVNLIASGFMLLGLRHGLPGGGTTAASRTEYVSAHATLWRIGWLSWHLAAFSLIALIVVLAELFRRASPLACYLAVVFGAAGLAADLAAE